MFGSFSIECMPGDIRSLSDWRSLLQPEERVFVPHISGRELDEQVEAVSALVKSGLRAVPHLAARNIASAAELGERLRRMSDAGAKDMLLLGGSDNPPKGGYDCALNLLESAEFRNSGIRSIAIAGHPEPHPDVDGQVMFDALVSKARLAQEMELDVCIVTQVCFDSAAIAAWIGRVREAGLGLPVGVGVAGPISLPRLLKVAAAIGVGNSLGFLRKSSRNLLQLVNPVYDPMTLLDDLARGCGDQDKALLPHFYAFGNVAASIGVARKLIEKHSDMSSTAAANA